MRTPFLAITAFMTLPLALPQEPVAPAPQPSPKPAAARQADYKTSVIRLRHAKPIALTHALNGIFGPRAEGPQRLLISIDESTDTIILSAPEGLLSEAIRIVNTLDTEPVATRQTRLVHLRHADAPELARLLSDSQSNQDSALPGGQRASVMCDPRTNTLLVISDEAQHRSLLPLIEKLDAAAAAPANASAPRSTRLELAAFAVDLPRDRVASIDSNSLSQDAATAESLLESLSKFGPSRIICRFDQPIDFGKPFETSLGGSVPFVAGSTKFKDQTSTQVNYQDVGCILALHGSWFGDASASGRFDFNLELSGVAESAIETGPGIKAPIMVKAKQEFGGISRSGRPIVLVSISAGEQGDIARAYVTRLVLTAEPEKSPT